MAQLVGCIGKVSGNDAGCSSVRTAFIESIVGDTSMTPAPASPVALQPRGPDPAFYLPAVVTELRFVERLVIVLTNDEARAGRLHWAPLASCNDDPRVPCGYHVSGYRLGYLT